MIGMKRFAAKLGFVHRTLWHRQTAYRWAALLGPPPLLGCAVAVAALAIAHQYAAHTPVPAAGSDVPWARWTRPVAQDGQPFTEPPGAALPASDGTAASWGFRPVGSVQSNL